MVKFIFTGFPRTGTTVVSGSLVLHSEVLFYGELFNNVPDVRATEASRITMGAGWKFDKQLNWGIAPCSFTQSTEGYLDDLFSQKAPFKAIGFKLMYDQCQDGPNSDAWNYIANHPEIKIIRTKRESVLESICSYVRAKMTRRWHITGGDLPSHKFIVPPNECLALFQKFEKLPEPLLEIDKTHQVLELEYNRIKEDFTGCMFTVFEFLGVTNQKVSEPRLKKIARLKPHEELVNYEELKQHFHNTEYGKHFT